MHWNNEFCSYRHSASSAASSSLKSFRQHKYLCVGQIPPDNIINKLINRSGSNLSMSVWQFSLFHDTSQSRRETIKSLKQLVVSLLLITGLAVHTRLVDDFQLSRLSFVWFRGGCVRSEEVKGILIAFADPWSFYYGGIIWGLFQNVSESTPWTHFILNDLMW